MRKCVPVLHKFKYNTNTLQDIYVLSGKVETKKGTCAIEFSGIVKAVANDVHDIKAGDRVCVLAPNSFRTTERVPAWACHKMLPDESFEVRHYV